MEIKENWPDELKLRRKEIERRLANGEPLEYDEKHKVIVNCDKKSVVFGTSYSSIPDGIKRIEQYAFKECNALKEVVIPDSVEMIEPYAFFIGCDNVNKLTLGNGLKEIGDYAFYWFCHVKELHIPKNVQKIGNEALSLSFSLEKITVDKENPFFDSRNDCNAVIETATDTLIKGCNNTVIPFEINKIASHAFSGMMDLKEITIPEGVTEIGDCALDMCESLREFTIPESVKTIGSTIFLFTLGFEILTIKSKNLQNIEYGLQHCGRMKKIIVPKGEAERYRAVLNDFNKDKIYEADE